MQNITSLILVGSWIILILISALVSKKIFPKTKEISRKIIHIGVGPVVPLAWLLNIPSHLAITFGSIISVLLLANYRFKYIQNFEDIERKSYGTVLYGISITLLLILFWEDHPDAVCAGVLAMAFGDGLAGLIGKQIKSPSWTIFNQKKSILGTFIMGFITLIVLSITNFYGGSSLDGLQIIVIGSITVALEQISPLGIDNLTVPLAVGIGWRLLPLLSS